MNKPTKLKTVKYKGLIYTIDNRLKEFRSLTEKVIKFIPFNSTEGKQILNKLNKEG